MLSSRQQNDIKTLSTACNNFMISLYKNLSTNIDNIGNIVISPLSLHMTLSLLSNGAGDHTLNEIKSVLHHDDIISLNNGFNILALLLNDMEDIELHITNKIYIQNGFDLMAEFLTLCTNVFQSTISRLDFKDNGFAVETINSWVKKATNNKIIHIVSSDDIDEDTKIMLINAIYFKSNWLRKFDKMYTVKRIFHVSKTETNLVPTMFQKSKFSYGKIPTWHTTFIEIPYLNQNIIMIILLPDREIELQVLENNFNWETLVNAPRFTDEIALYLPKFKFEITINLENVLRKVGLNTMFQDNADFTRLSSTPLKVSCALQKIFIEINEEGSEAAAATVVGMRLKRMAILPMEFVVDRPFLFVIEHKPSRIPLFLGCVRKIEFFQDKDEL
ncbi:antichymotrypsin-2 isoform X2 [Monomorium pharaonis]|nr:antichymotrypsin-2 isoform X2 [Monomorium pharaonis]XP_028047666.1 antichymotrypsin-2 isoform X2 [Monomorium pharaonis]XP_028047667.1 antichymotrypsin-2 isoform X2 [Monomorium pharaonis]XP_028047668.1 antichymotrypsin-2 isoform X2 [Monomorium pharaonis]XP_028047669.1 antichymotrypsin-2 isoform X2 [Monomorium pharaonis]XP_036147838.1 antichymotrypsin-2 isoform X2 [Monomorium pharaonis]XP_036147845.1 antichymotrypsin-2 isoform X2 [Monomorium pharaonis]